MCAKYDPIPSKTPILWTTRRGSQYIMPLSPADHPTMPKSIVFYFIVFTTILEQYREPVRVSVSSDYGGGFFLAKLGIF
jgi:hypothetical protein